jgi:DNA-3-methyladenine glycosylase II
VETIAIKVRTPFPWLRLLRYLSRRLIPRAERIEDASYVRNISGREIVVAYDASTASLQIHCESELAARARERISVLFDVAHDASPIDAHLARAQPLRDLIRDCSGLRPLGTWSAFELCCRTILGQQVTVAAANTLMSRLIERCGELTADAVLKADLQKLGMPGARVRTLQTFATVVREGTLDLGGPWPEVDSGLAALPGFGPWTRTYLAIRLGRDADAFPASDVGLLRATGAASTTELLQLAESWRPYRAVAAAYLWMQS